MLLKLSAQSIPGVHQVNYDFNSERLHLVLDSPGDRRRGQMHRPFWQGVDSATLLVVGEA